MDEETRELLPLTGDKATDENIMLAYRVWAWHNEPRPIWDTKARPYK